jgi:hypothetical protein
MHVQQYSAHSRSPVLPLYARTNRTFNMCAIAMMWEVPCCHAAAHADGEVVSL